MAPPQIAARLQQAFADHAAGRADAAFTECRAILRLDSKLAGAHYLMGLIWLERGEPRKAIDALKLALTCGPDNPALRMALGRAYRAGGALAMAVVEYENAVFLAPGYGEALHALGTVRLESGDAAGAVDSFYEVTILDPDNPAIQAAYGAALRQAGRVSDAITAFRRAVDLVPDSARHLSNLGVALMEAGQVVAALVPLARAVEIDPTAAFRRNLGLGLMAAGQYGPAADLFEALLEEAEDEAQALLDLAGAMGKAGEDVTELLTGAVADFAGDARLWYALAEAHRAAGRADDAIDAYDRCLELDPTDRVGASLGLALCGADPAPAAPPPAYVAQLFDDYAGRFDSELTGALAYRGPEVLMDLLNRLAPDRQFTCTYDLGCGTGLMAPLIRPRTGRLLGVDLSARMVAQARARALYDGLAVEEVVRWLLQQKAGAADLMIAADVLVYLGDLKPFLEAARRGLAPKGMLLFSLEAAADPATAYDLHAGHRYAHGMESVRALLRGAGFGSVEITPASTRQNQGRPVPGLLVAAF